MSDPDDPSASMFDPRFADQPAWEGGPAVSDAIREVIEAEKAQLVPLLADLGDAGASAIRDYMAHISVGISIDAGLLADRDAAVAASVALENFHFITNHPEEVRAQHPDDPEWATKYMVGWVTAASTMQRRYMAMSAAQTTVMGAMGKAAPDEHERQLFLKALSAAQQILATMRGRLVHPDAPDVPSIAVETARKMVSAMWSDQSLALTMALDAAEAEVNEKKDG